MKQILIPLMAAALRFGAMAADVPAGNSPINPPGNVPSPLPTTQPKASQSLLNGISVSTVGAYNTADFVSGKSQWGAGLALDLPVNPFVSIEGRALSFEGTDQFGGSTIDEVAVMGRARFVSLVKEKLGLYGTGGALYSFDRSEWGFGIGSGLEYRFNRNFSATAGAELRAWFKGSHDWLYPLSLKFSF